MLLIQDITKFTFQDYPNYTACIIWFGNCNLKCKYCHNSDLVNINSGKILSEDYVLKFLESRIGLLDGVVLSGGECTLSKDFINFVKKVKDLGYKTKIDTNGINYSIINYLVENNLIDFVALDFKSMPDKFEAITQKNLFKEFDKTLKYLIDKNNNNLIKLEIRTTVHTDLLQENDINNIIEYLDSLNFSSNYFIQNFRNENNKILSNISDQKYILDKNKIKKPKKFNIDFRNFF